MSSQIFIHAKPHTKIILLLLVLSFNFSFAWEVDFSRRKKDIERHKKQRMPASEVKIEEPTSFFSLPQLPNKVNTPSQDIVILNTASGFVPKQFAVKANTAYKIHVVNINENEKNVSFILNSFNEHHGTYYGVVKSFNFTPSVEGIFTYQSPETSFEGKIIVLPEERGLASQK